MYWSTYEKKNNLKIKYKIIYILKKKKKKKKN